MSWSTSGCLADLRFPAVKFPTSADFSTVNLVNRPPISDRCGVCEAAGRSASNFRPVATFRAKTRPIVIKFPTIAEFLKTTD
jgi:hypothetical protein